MWEYPRVYARLPSPELLSIAKCLCIGQAANCELGYRTRADPWILVNRWQPIEGTTRIRVRGLQTYEGGIGGEPGNEAHGGYAFCGAAAMALAGRLDSLDLPSLARWAVNCQACTRQKIRMV